MANQTIISVPTNFADFKQIRTFVIRLIEQLDIVLGYRSNSGYEVSGTASTLLADVVSENTEQQLKFGTELSTLTDALNQFIIATNEAFEEVNDTLDTIQQGTIIADLSYTAPTVSATYNQSEVQGIADQLQTTSDKLDSLLAVLRAAEIIS
tara:strand:+ start:3014 stop:3469 length:456 start_codon:yes stop_codon:yes gene_type:complete